LCSLTGFDLTNRVVRQPVQPHTFYARLLVFDKTLAQPHFAVANCSDHRSRQIFGGAKDFCPNFPKLAPKNLQRK